MRGPRLVTALLALAAVAAVAACGSDGGAAGSESVTLNLGYLTNLTHATALAGIGTGMFADALGPDVELRPQAFNAGPEVVEALFGGAVDAAYLGPNPAINAFAQSDGRAIRIIAGATSGGAFLVVKPSVTAANQLKGATLASPQLGNTQDVALRTWLKGQGLSTNTTGGGDVSVVPQPNGESLSAFIAGDIDGAWVPEPWATRLAQEGGGKVLVDEADLWPGGRYVTTHLVVRTEYLAEHPDVVTSLLTGHLATTDYLNTGGAAARRAVNDTLESVTGKRVADRVIDAAWVNLTFTSDPVASSLAASARSAEALGLLDQVDLTGIHDLAILNRLLAVRGGEPTVKGL